MRKFDEVGVKSNENKGKSSNLSNKFKALRIIKTKSNDIFKENGICNFKKKKEIMIQ